jgi:hypothetical protein
MSFQLRASGVFRGERLSMVINNSSAEYLPQSALCRTAMFGADAVWKSGTGVTSVKSRARCACHVYPCSLCLHVECLLRIIDHSDTEE